MATKNDQHSEPLVKTPGTRLALAVTDLKHALDMTAPAIAGRTSIPAMQHVLIADGRLTAADGDLRIEAALPGAGADAPPVLLQGGRLARIAATCDRASELRLEPGKSTCTIKNKTGRWVLPTCAPDEFPAAPTGKLWPMARLPGDQLARCLRTVLPAISRSTTQQNIGGMLIDVTDGVVSFVATDGYRLHVHTVEIDQATDNQATVVPLRAANCILAIAEEAGFDAVQLGVSKAMIVASSARTTLTASPLNINFPAAWRELIGKKSTEPTRVQAGRLLAATRAASITTSETSRGVTYSITPEGILLTGKSPEAGESKVACDIYEYGAGCQVMMPPQHVAQFLESIESLEIVDLEASSPDSPVALRCEDRLCIISPLSV